ncbi:hypothetical protein SLS62_003733 [Diatrype stigma]|uniref:Inositolphosphotransferase Aur1/Ipt1 domain-containing protein n=1 Tax=Diatrype stigma TaxID=117547 RepID=A0AAN9UVC0_9PEZI
MIFRQTGAAAMAIGAFIEPLVVITLLSGGVYVNRNTNYSLTTRNHKRRDGDDRDVEASWVFLSAGSVSPAPRDNVTERGVPSSQSQESRWRTREIGIWYTKWQVKSPNTQVFRDYFLSRLLVKFPFLVEVWYWALIYWVRSDHGVWRQSGLTKHGQVYQLGRAFTALTLVEGTVNIARHHALQVIHLEQRLRIFWEPAIQQAFMKHATLMHWINRIYSFIHIPGTILFLGWLYYYTTVRNRVDERQENKDIGEVAGSPGGTALYQARRRTMAVCNLLAFIVFTAWPCMPPRLLGDPSAQGGDATEGRTYGFVDTVHGKEGESSVWTQNRFCNQYGICQLLTHAIYSRRNSR